MQAATVTATQTLEFFDDGTFTEKIPQRAQFSTPIVSGGTYRLQAPDRIFIKFEDTDSHQEEVNWLYTTSGNMLTIRPTCREGCAFIYKKI